MMKPLHMLSSFVTLLLTQAVSGNQLALDIVIEIEGDIAASVRHAVTTPLARGLAVYLHLDGVDKVIVQSTSVAFAQGMTTTCHALVTFADGNDNGLNDIALIPVCMQSLEYAQQDSVPLLEVVQMSGLSWARGAKVVSFVLNSPISMPVEVNRRMQLDDLQPPLAADGAFPYQSNFTLPGQSTPGLIKNAAAEIFRLNRNEEITWFPGHGVILAAARSNLRSPAGVVLKASQLTSGALSYPWTQDATAVTGFSKSVQGLSPPYMGRKLLSAIGYFHQPGQMELLTVIVPKVFSQPFPPVLSPRNPFTYPNGQVPTGQVLLSDDMGNVVGNATLSGGKALVTVNVGPAMTSIDTIYSGDSYYAASASVAPFIAFSCAETGGC